MIGFVVIYVTILCYLVGLFVSLAIINDKDYEKPYVAFIWPVVLVLLLIKYTIKAFKALPEIWKM